MATIFALLVDSQLPEIGEKTAEPLSEIAAIPPTIAAHYQVYLSIYQLSVRVTQASRRSVGAFRSKFAVLLSTARVVS